MNYIDPMVETVKDFGRITGVMDMLKNRVYTKTQALKEIGRIIKENELRSLPVPPKGIILVGGKYRYTRDGLN